MWDHPSPVWGELRPAVVSCLDKGVCAVARIFGTLERALTAAITPRLRTAVRIFIAWTVYSLLVAQQSYMLRLTSARPGTWIQAFLDNASYAYSWALLTPLIFYLGAKLPLAPPVSVRNGLIHLFVSVALALLTEVVSLLCLTVTDPERYPLPTRYGMMRSAFIMADYGTMLYWVVLLIHHALRYLQQRNEANLRTAELQTQLAGAQLQALKMQLQPHFLFNALNSVSELIHQDPNTADRMLALISDLLRTFLQIADTQEVRLEEEIGILERYLEIQKIRFEDRLRFRINIPEGARDAMVPSLILQPLMENAVRHGIANRESDAFIEIAAKREDRALLVTVADNGRPGKPACPDEFIEGTGLRNTRRRLAALYGSGQRFEIRASPHGGIEAMFSIPFRVYTGKQAAAT